MSDLLAKTCKPCEGGVKPLNAEEARSMLAEIVDWKLIEQDTAIVRQFRFKNFHETMAFVNAVAWIAHQEDHHPDVTFGYNTCQVCYKTHAISGLSENDFICAAKINNLLPKAMPYQSHAAI